MMRIKDIGSIAVALLIGMGSTVQAADFVAYSVQASGGKTPLPKELGTIEPKHLLNLEWGKYSGKKTRIGVLPVENRSSAGSVSVTGYGGSVTYRAGHGGVPVQGIEAIVTDVMHSTNRFRLVERAKLDAAIREQDLGASGRIAKPSAAKVGKVLGAEYLFQAVVTHYEAGVEQKGGGLGGLVGGSAGALLGAIAVKESKADLGMNFRLIDATTSEILYTDQVQVEIVDSGLTFGGFGVTGGAAAGGFLSNYSKTPIGQAVISAVNRGVYNLVKQVGAGTATGSVVKVKGGKIYLNLGSAAVSKNETLSLVRVGEALIDPDTGLNLGGEEEEIGTLKVTLVKDKFSIAKPLDIKASRIKRGDKVVSLKEATPLMYASNWTPPAEEKSGLFGGGSSTTNEEPSDDNGFSF